MPISPKDFLRYLIESKINFFAGVPDSLLKGFCKAIDSEISEDKHIITANEGTAIGLAAGYNLATGEIPIVYMQNSGLGNAINPLMSLCDSEVYSIPMLLLIGWRGEPGSTDEPQHVKQGKIQENLLEVTGIPYEIISAEDNMYKPKIDSLISISREKKIPVALLVSKGTFKIDDYGTNNIDNNLILREEALSYILKIIDNKSIIVSNTGKTSRELFELREKNGQSHQQEFLTVGSMGHCSAIALGIALSKPKNKVFCLDGDGSMLMHLGGLSMIAKLSPKNFKHILLNNEVHESVGGQETAAKYLNMSNVAKNLGYKNIYSIDNESELEAKLKSFINDEGPSFFEIKIRPGSRAELGRPTNTPIKNKDIFTCFLNNI
tara:strand:- start:230 stop:1363 length:1134 start_codon:yes stop_codon:yes gene_type:complete